MFVVRTGDDAAATLAPPSVSTRVVEAARRRPGAVVVGAAMALYIAVFGTLTWRQQSNFGTFGFDMGIYDQAIWLLSRFKTPFVTIRGLNYFGHHVNLITLAIVPFYWLGAGPHFLYLLETVWVAVGAVPIYLLGRDLLHEELSPAVIACAYLLHPTLQWINWWHFHPDALIITPLLFAWLFARRRRWVAFAVCAFVALTCKEDAALAVLMLGVLVAVFWHRIVGAVTAATGAAWFLIATRVVIPHANGGIPPFYDSMFPTLGVGLPQIAKNATLHPSRLWHPLTERHRVAYYGRLLAPVGFVALLALPVLLIGGPQTVINATSSQGYTDDARFHYSAIIVTAIFLATVEACAFWGRNRLVRGVLVGLVGWGALAANVAWSPSPVGRPFHTGIWAGPSPRFEVLHRAIGMIPASAGVSGTYDVVTHLTHRQHIFEFPNPWVLAYWGIRGERPPDTRTVDWILLDQPLDAKEKPLFDALVAPDGEFTVVLSGHGVTLAHRVRAAERVHGPPPSYSPPPPPAG